MLLNLSKFDKLKRLLDRLGVDLTTHSGNPTPFT